MQPKLGILGSIRFAWRQLTSMRTALLLLLLLAVAAVPGSLVPQRSSDPNGVTQYFQNNPDLAPFLDSIQMFDVYTSVWFSAIYLLLFTSLIGCVIPRCKHHWKALRANPPKTPARLARMSGYRTATVSSSVDAITTARTLLKARGYRVAVYEDRTGTSVSAERGYLRETGNLVFHIALLGILVAVGVGGGYGYAGQRVLVEGQSFVNYVGDYDSFNPGRFVDSEQLHPYRLGLSDLSVTYETENVNAIGQAIDYTADVTVQSQGQDPQDGSIKVNEPLRFEGTDVFLLGNGYAPTVTVRNTAGEVVFSDSIPFLPQDTNLTSLGIIKVPDGLAEQVGMIGFFYPTQGAAEPPFFSSYPDLENPVLTLNVWKGDLGINEGVPRSVYALDTDGMTQLAGGHADTESLRLSPGESVDLPDGLGTVAFDDASPVGAADGDSSQSVLRFASFDIHHDPTQGWVLLFAILVLAGLLTGLFVPRRRLWVKAVPQPDGSVLVEYAGLARGEDPALDDAIASTASQHARELGLPT